MEGFRWDCEFCDAAISVETIDEVKSRGETHLVDNHSDQLTGALAETYGGERCRNDCGYVFPVDVEEVAGFDCPECEHDNFSPFVQRYLYWRIERL